MAPNMSGGFNPRAGAEGEVVCADWVGAAVGSSRRGGDLSGAAGAGEGSGRRRDSAWCLGNYQKSKIAAKPRRPRVSAWWATGPRTQAKMGPWGSKLG